MDMFAFIAHTEIQMFYHGEAEKKTKILEMDVGIEGRIILSPKNLIYVVCFRQMIKISLNSNSNLKRNYCLHFHK